MLEFLNKKVQTSALRTRCQAAHDAPDLVAGIRAGSWSEFYLSLSRCLSQSLSGIRWPGDGAANNDNDARNDNRVGGFRGFHGSPRALIAGTVRRSVSPSGCPERRGNEGDGDAVRPVPA